MPADRDWRDKESRQREAKVTVRLTPDERDTITEAARLSDRPREQWIRYELLKLAKRVIGRAGRRT